MTRHVPIETPLGVLAGRDCIYLDDVGYETSTLTLRGQINGDLCEKRVAGTFLRYTLRFSGVVAVNITALDAWRGRSGSSFDEVKPSPWLASLAPEATENHRHYFVQTYDDVIELVCIDYQLEVHTE